MTLGEALGLINRPKEHSRRRQIFLVCGFQPLHLGTLLQGHIAQRFPDDGPTLLTGLYGDFENTLTSAGASHAEAAAVVIEWSDLDPRLGLRSAGGWAISAQADILQSCEHRFVRLLFGLEALGAKMPVALVPPTLPSSLLGHTAGWQWSASELDLQRQLATFLVAAARIRGVAVMSSAALARVSPEASRLDPQMELRAGFPYTITHSSAVANLVVKLLFPPAPMKGLITDLDETFWAGIVGEDGVRGVSWTLTDHAAIHGLYQQMLAHLAEMGVLLAVASKNELSVVEEAFERDDLLVEGKTFFPVLANWGPKSESIAEILRVWNIGADGVVFVDDSGLELDEVQQAFPAMKCLQFTKKQPAKVLALLEQLRDLFGKPAVQREDALRQSSIRANASLQAAAADTVDGQFLLGLKGRVAFDCKKDPANKRLLDLINKTNQFNLNGVRVSEGEWLRHLQDRNALVCGVSYEDKFGPLGSIGVLSGVHSDDKLQVTSWVLSCRAFSRKIEDHMLNHLFNHHGVAALRFAFRATDRNQPLRSYLASLGLDAETGGTQELSREQFQNRNEELPHQVRTQDI